MKDYFKDSLKFYEKFEMFWVDYPEREGLTSTFFYLLNQAYSNYKCKNMDQLYSIALNFFDGKQDE